MKLISSWWCTAALVFVLAALYFRLSFGENAYRAWASLIFRTPFGLALYGFLVLNLVFASVRVVLRRLRGKKGAVTPGSVMAMDIYVALPPGASLDAARAFMEAKGFRPTDLGGGLRAARGTLSVLPGTVFRVGLVIFMASLAVSTHTREATETLAKEGECVCLPAGEAYLENVKAALPAEFLQVGDRSTFSLSGVHAVVSAGGRTADVTPGFPARLGGYYLHLVHVGYSLPVASGGNQAILDLDVLPPGKTHKVQLPGVGEVSFALEPAKTVNKGLLTGKSYDLAHPQFRVFPAGGGQPLVLKPGGSSTAGAAAVSLGKESLYVKVEAVRDPALLFVYAGLLITLAGGLFMITRLFWYERWMCAAAMEDGGVLLGYSEEFYKRWGVYRFRQWRSGLSAGS